MDVRTASNTNKAVDAIQKRLTDYASGLDFSDLSPEAIHAAKVRIIDTLGALIGGFFGKPCLIARNLAAQLQQSGGATVIGTRTKTALDMAAFVNGTTARFLEANDVYRNPTASHGHPSDTLAPVLAVAEYARASGREFILAAVLAYEAFLRTSDGFEMLYDSTCFCCLGTAVAAGKLLRLSPDQLSHCISMAVVPNVSLQVTRFGQMSMWKATAAGQAGRSGVFAALMARAGMEGPHLPFEGKAGWCDHVAHKRFALLTMGGRGTPFKVQDSWIKMRFSAAKTIPPILAAEEVASSLKNIKDIKQIIVEVNRNTAHRSFRAVSDSEQNVVPELEADVQTWNPESSETADKSIPYCVAATLIDGVMTPRSFNEDHLWNPDLRGLMQKLEIVPNDEFSRLFDQVPSDHRARVTVLTNDGERLVGESGSSNDGLSHPKTDAQIETKFRGLTEETLGTKRVTRILDRLWHLEDLSDVAAIPSAFTLE